MITQTLKRWLNKLFAWWPWGRSDGRSYSGAMSSLNRGTTQELVWRTSVEGYVPQPGITSVVIEHVMDGMTDITDITPEVGQDTANELSERISQSYQPALNEVPPSPTPQNNEMNEPFLTLNEVVAASNEEQHLTFLHYLVKRGVYNEGFLPGQEPEQYKQR